MTENNLVKSVTRHRDGTVSIRIDELTLATIQMNMLYAKWEHSEKALEMDNEGKTGKAVFERNMATKFDKLNNEFSKILYERND